MLTLPALLGCGSSTSGKVVVPLDGTGQTTSRVDPNDPGTATVLSAALPAKFVLDGDIAEWGSLVPVAAPSPKAEKGKAAPVPKALPPSHVALALHAEGAAIAAELTPAMSDSFWVALALDRPEVPSVGIYMPGGSIMALPCEFEEQAAEMEPAELESCKKMLANHARFTEQYLDRFQALYQIGPSGVSVLRSGKLVPLPEAKFATKPKNGGKTVEVSLPAKALPRTMQAPVASFFAYAEANKTDEPALRKEDDSAWTLCDIAAPVGFAPYAELREAVLASASMRYTMFRPYKPNNLSYQPGDGLEIEDADYPGDSTSVETFTRILYSKQATMGDVEVGYTYIGKPGPGAAEFVSLLSLKKGVPVQPEVLLGEPKGIVKRDGELHVIAYWHEYDDNSSAQMGHWAVAAIGAEGQIRTDIVQTGLTPPQGFSSLTEGNEPDFSAFRIMGMVMDAPDGADPITITWKYDATAREYLLVVPEERPAKPTKPRPRIVVPPKR